MYQTYKHAVKISLGAISTVLVSTDDFKFG